MKMLPFLLKLIRWNDWYGKLFPVFTAGYIWILLQTPTPSFAVTHFITLLLFASVFLTFVFVVNDFYDRDIDQRAGKFNGIGQLGLGTGVTLLVALVAAGVLILAPFYQQNQLTLFVVISYISAATYSMPPARFKERGTAGLLVAATHRALPILVGIALFDDFRLSSWLLFVLFVLVGIRWNIVHQLIDFSNDKETQVDTFVQVYGYERSLSLMKGVVFPLEISCLLAWFVLTSVQLPVLLYLAPIYGIWCLLLFLWRRRNGATFNWTSYWRIPLREFYDVLCPFFLGVVLAIQEPAYLILLFLQVSLYLPRAFSFFRGNIIKYRVATN